MLCPLRGELFLETVACRPAGGRLLWRLLAFREGLVPFKHLPRKKIPADIRSLARSHTNATIVRLANLVVNPGADEPASTSVSAAALILGYGWGKPHQTLAAEHGGAIEITIRKMMDG